MVNRSIRQNTNRFSRIEFFGMASVCRIFQKATPLPDGKSDPLLSEVHLFVTSREFIISYPSQPLRGRLTYTFGIILRLTRSLCVPSRIYRIHLVSPICIIRNISQLRFLELILTQRLIQRKKWDPTNLNGAYNSWWNFLSHGGIKWSHVQAALNFEDQLLIMESIVYERSMQAKLACINTLLKTVGSFIKYIKTGYSRNRWSIHSKFKRPNT